MCLFDFDDIVSIACRMAVVLSQKSGTLESLNPSSLSNKIWKNKSFAASYIAINSACAELVAGIPCNLLFQLVGPQEKAIYPDVDFLPHLSSEFKDNLCPAQSESVNPASLTTPLHSVPSKINGILGFLFKYPTALHKDLSCL